MPITMDDVHLALAAGDNAKAIDMARQLELSPQDIASLSIVSCFDRAIPFLRWIIGGHPETLHQPNVEGGDCTRLNAMLQVACMINQGEVARVLVGEYGADAGSGANGIENRPVNSACDRGNLELTRFLLDSGASPNHTANGRLASYALLGAAHKGHLPVVRLLVERGALVNARNALGLSPLTYAQMGRHQETIDYLLSVGAQEPWQIRGDPGPPPPLDSDPRPETVDGHLLTLEGVYDDMGVAAQDAARPDWPVAVRRYNVGQGMLLLATEGMASVPLPPPAGAADTAAYRRAELYTYVEVPTREHPAEDWPEGHPEERWIGEWLIRLARYPAENGEWLGPAAVLANGEPPEPLAPGVPFTCWLLASYADRPISAWERRDGEVVRLYHAYPIHTAERDYERAHGVDALLGRLAASGAPQFIDPARPSAV